MKTINSRKIRYAKSFIRRQKRDNSDKGILWGLTLKPGDVIQTCTGYNEVIASITPEWMHYHRSAMQALVDFFVVSKGGGGYSLMNCCDPSVTREYIMEWMKKFIESKNQAVTITAFEEAVASGEALAENGTLNMVGEEKLKEKFRLAGIIPK